MGCLIFAAAIPGFFISSAILMGLWTVIAPNFNLPNISYPTAMLITITLWLVVAPLVMAGRRKIW